MKIKLSQYNPRSPDPTITEVSTLIIEITLESLEIGLGTFSIHVMKKDTFARDCPKNKSSSHKKKGHKKRHHAHAAEDDEPSSKRTRYESEDSSSKDEYVLISALTGNITHGK